MCRNDGCASESLPARFPQFGTAAAFAFHFWRGSDGSACITITDRGVGISPEARDRIFNLFYTTKKGGTGIGLAQAFRAVQLHNGTIRLASEVGVGTTFEIILPAMI